RSVAAALQQSGYFRIAHTTGSEAEAEALVERGEVQFMVVIPPDFTRRIVRGEPAPLLVSVDATDPSASGNAIGALQPLLQQAFAHDATGPLAKLALAAP